jgi:hypothetical protein
LTGCSYENNVENKLSEDRIADIALLQIKIEGIDSQISLLFTSNRQLSSDSLHSQKFISNNQTKISELKSQKEILEKEVLVFQLQTSGG